MFWTYFIRNISGVLKTKNCSFNFMKFILKLSALTNKLVTNDTSTTTTTTTTTSLLLLLLFIIIYYYYKKKIIKK